MQRFLWVALAVLASSACEVGQVEDSGFRVDLLASANRMSEKVAIARMFAEGKPVLDDLNPGLPAGGSSVAHDALATQYGQRVAEKLRQLSPDLTYISGLLRINDPSYQLTPDEITAFRAVRQAFPNAKLDITLSMKFQGHDNRAADLEGLMQRLDAALSPGVWFFDFFDEGGHEADGSYTAHDVIAWVHHHEPGKLIGGNYFNSAPADAHGTGAADFFAVADNKDFVLDQQRINGLHNSFHAPVLVHVSNNPQAEPLDAQGHPVCVDTGTRCVEAACVYIHDWSFAQQRDYVTRRATQHAADNYHYMYNVFFPACPLTNYYEAQQVKDGNGRSMLDVMHDLIQ